MADGASGKAVVRVVVALLVAAALAGGALAWVSGPGRDTVRLALARHDGAVPATLVATGQNTGWAYGCLPPELQPAYLAMLQALSTRERVISPTDSYNDLELAFAYCMADHPELFDVTGADYVTDTRPILGDTTTIQGSYACSATLAGIRREAIGAARDEWLDGAPADDWGLAKHLYDHLIERTSYEVDAEDSQNIVSVLLNGQSVCNGYAKTLQYLLLARGVPAVTLTGTARGVGHAWCAAMLDGQWYIIDPTWGDVQFQQALGMEGELSGFVNYDYFCATTEDLLATHVPSGTPPAPTCTAREGNYYVHEGCWLDEPDVEAAGALIERARDAGDRVVRLRCGSADVFAELFRALIDDEEVFRFTGGTAIHYTYSDALCTLTILL